MTNTFERLSAILVKDYKLAPGSLTPDTVLDSLGIDSLGTVELLWNIEDEFKLKLPPDPVDLATVGDVVDYIDQLVAKQNAAAAAPPAVPSMPAMPGSPAQPA
jgi:acyl carrier protein